MVALLVVAHLVVAPVGLAAGTQQLTMMNRILTGSNPSIPLDLPESTRVVAVNTPTDLLGASLPIHRSARQQPVNQHWWWLYAGVDAVSVKRISERALILRPEQPYLAPTWAQVFRAPRNAPLQTGDRFQLDGLNIEVLAAGEDGRPTTVRFEFDTPLEDPSLHFVQWRNGAYLPFPLPANGETHTVPGAQLAALVPIALGQDAN